MSSQADQIRLIEDLAAFKVFLESMPPDFKKSLKAAKVQLMQDSSAGSNRPGVDHLLFWNIFKQHKIVIGTGDGKCQIQIPIEAWCRACMTYDLKAITEILFKEVRCDSRDFNLFFVNRSGGTVRMELNSVAKIGIRNAVEWLLQKDNVQRDPLSFDHQCDNSHHAEIEDEIILLENALQECPCNRVESPVQAANAYEQLFLDVMRELRERQIFANPGHVVKLLSVVMMPDVDSDVFMNGVQFSRSRWGDTFILKKCPDAPAVLLKLMKKSFLNYHVFANVPFVRIEDLSPILKLAIVRSISKIDEMRRNNISFEKDPHDITAQFLTPVQMGTLDHQLVELGIELQSKYGNPSVLAQPDAANADMVEEERAASTASAVDVDMMTSAFNQAGIHNQSGIHYDDIAGPSTTISSELQQNMMHRFLEDGVNNLQSGSGNFFVFQLENGEFVLPNSNNTITSAPPVTEIQTGDSHFASGTGTSSDSGEEGDSCGSLTNDNDSAPDMSTSGYSSAAVTSTSSPALGSQELVTLELFEEYPVDEQLETLYRGRFGADGWAKANRTMKNGIPGRPQKNVSAGKVLVRLVYLTRYIPKGAPTPKEGSDEFNFIMEPLQYLDNKFTRTPGRCYSPLEIKHLKRTVFSEEFRYTKKVLQPKYLASGKLTVHPKPSSSGDIYLFQKKQRLP